MWCLYLVPAALAGLQAGENLALNGRHPGVALLQARGLEVPRLAGGRHDDEVCVLLVWWGERIAEQDGLGVCWYKDHR